MEEKQTDKQDDIIYIKGIGSITSVGEYDMEKLIKRLLKSKYITR